MSAVRFEYECTLCPGDGAKRPGIDWPTECPCKSRKVYSQYQIARLIDDDAKAIVRVNELRAKGDVATRVFRKLGEWLGIRAGERQRPDGGKG